MTSRWPRHNRFTSHALCVGLRNLFSSRASSGRPSARALRTCSSRAEANSSGRAAYSSSAMRSKSGSALMGVVLSPPTLLARQPSRSVVRYADGVVSRVTIPTSATLALLAGATVLSRLPFLTPRLAHWDAVNYALGLHDFNVAAHQPHPPGSPYFILLARLALAVTADDNAALILVSLVASVGAVIGEYALARMLFGPRA